MFNSIINRQTRQFIQTYTYSTSSQHKLYNEICHVYLHIFEIKNEQISVSLTVTIEKKNILHTHWLTRTYIHAPRTYTRSRTQTHTLTHTQFMHTCIYIVNMRFILVIILNKSRYTEKIMTWQHQLSSL